MGNWTLMWKERNESKSLSFDDNNENYSRIKDELDSLKARKARGEITGLKGLRPDGTAALFNDSPNLVYGAMVSFGTKSKYPYESPGKLEINDEVLVDPNGVLTIGRVVECAKMERSALVALCNGHRLRKIIAKIDRMKKGA